MAEMPWIATKCRLYEYGEWDEEGFKAQMFEYLRSGDDVVDVRFVGEALMRPTTEDCILGVFEVRYTPERTVVELERLLKIANEVIENLLDNIAELEREAEDDDD